MYKPFPVPWYPHHSLELLNCQFFLLSVKGVHLRMLTQTTNDICGQSQNIKNWQQTKLRKYLEVSAPSYSIPASKICNHRKVVHCKLVQTTETTLIVKYNRYKCYNASLCHKLESFATTGVSVLYICFHFSRSSGTIGGRNTRDKVRRTLTLRNTHNTIQSA